jgi:hypothetical protein
MDLELATLNDIVEELRRRRMRFVLVAVEPTNNATSASVLHAAQGMDVQDLVGLVKMAWQEVMKHGSDGDGDTPPHASMN